MKGIIRSAIMVFLFSACGNVNEKKVQEPDITTVSGQDMNKLKEMGASTDEMTAKIAELKNLTPLDLEQLKALLPSELNGMKRRTATADSSAGYSVAQGRYQTDSNTNITVMIYDCAGEAGATAYTLTYWGAINAEQESENQSIRTVDFRGGKAIEEFKKDINETTLTYVTNGRLLVTLTGRNTEPSALKDAALGLTFKL